MTDKPDIDPSRRAFGARLAAARQGKFTQQEIATRFSLNKATVSAWETGRGIPDALTLRDLAKLYGVTADSLLWEEALSSEAVAVAKAFDQMDAHQKRTASAIWAAYMKESYAERPMPVQTPSNAEKQSATLPIVGTTEWLHQLNPQQSTQVEQDDPTPTKTAPRRRKHPPGSAKTG